MNDRELTQHLHDLEQLLLLPETRASAELLAAHLHEDFAEYGSSGRVFDRAGIIRSMTENREPLTYQLSNFELLRLAADAALVTYAIESFTGEGKPLTASLRSSVWRFTNGRWRMFFHQGTRRP